MRVNLSTFSAKNKKLNIVNTLIIEFCKDNDIKYSNKLMTEYISHPNGVKSIANWAKSKGYKISYWCLEPIKSYNELSGNKPVITWIGFGLDIDESCPMVIETVLKAEKGI